MNPEIKAKWIEALRSGEYEQGSGKLATVGPDSDEIDRFCCLGVLCEIAIQEGLPIEVEAIHWDGRVAYRRYNEEVAYLPFVVRDWAGLADSNPSVLDPRYRDAHSVPATLSLLNDEDLSFARIADIIEEQL